MITKERSATVLTIGRRPVTPDFVPVVSDAAGRLVQMTLAIYLLPVLLVVLGMGGLGMLAIWTGRFFAGPLRGSSS